MNFQDIFKNSFLNDFSYTIDTKGIVVNLALAAFFALYIFFIYRAVTRKTFYSKNFNVSLMMMTIITAAIIITIQSNIVLSLGMVGALSIVRFRTAVKDPLDLGFLYWAISIGIICGAGLTAAAVVLSLIVTAVIVFVKAYPVKKPSMILVVNCKQHDSEDKILETVKNHCKQFKIKSKTSTTKSLDLVIELKISAETSLLKELMAIDGVETASILAHDGEITAA